MYVTSCFPLELTVKLLNKTPDFWRQEVKWEAEETCTSPKFAKEKKQFKQVTQQKNIMAPIVFAK